jgi:serine/threonine-protein kinase
VVKVLDFGLAKIAEPATVLPNPEDSPTLTIEATRMGQILGTAAYMASEQARGHSVDKRADIWAFGVVLYAMLTGRRLFQGETISDTLASVLAKEPVWERVPLRARKLLRRCLEKGPKRRLRDIGDAWQLLNDAPAALSAGSNTIWAAAAFLAMALAGFLHSRLSSLHRNTHRSARNPRYAQLDGSCSRRHIWRQSKVNLISIQRAGVPYRAEHLG